MVVWWGTEIECVSAIARAERDALFTSTEANEAMRRLDSLATRWHVIQAGDRVRQNARRLLRVHALRAGDALQLAGALVAAEDQLASLELVSFDARVVEAASREGFSVIERK